MQDNIRRGDIYYADLGKGIGSEQNGLRPVVIVQNNAGNRYSPTTIVVSAVTSKITKPLLPTHISLSDVSGLTKNSLLLLEQIRTIDCKRLKEYVGHLDNHMMSKANEALKISLGLHEKTRISYEF